MNNYDHVILTLLALTTIAIRPEDDTDMIEANPAGYHNLTLKRKKRIDHLQTHFNRSSSVNNA